MGAITEVLLVHEDGPDRRSVVAYLKRRGLEVRTFTDVSELPPKTGGTSAVLLQQQRVANAAPEALDPLRADALLIVPQNERPLPGFVRTIREPYFLDQLATELGSRRPAVPAPAAGAPIAADRGDLLRGIAHAMNNPVTAALGWLKVLEMELEGGAGTGAVAAGRSARTLVHLRTELDHLARIAQAFAVLGGRAPRLTTAVDLGAVVAQHVRRLADDGRRVDLRVGPGRIVALGDPAEYEIFFALALSTAREEAAGRPIEADIATDGPLVRVSISDSAAGYVPTADAADLGSLLRAYRHAQALGTAMAEAIARRVGGTFVVERIEPRGARFALTVPAAAESGAGRGAP